jgi:hypothetical protein
MIETLEKYCPKCGYKIDPQHERFCHCCGEPIIREEEQAPLSENDVKDIPIVGPSPVDEVKKRGQSKDPWLSGSYYLVVIPIALTLFLVALKLVNPVFLPFVIIFTLFGISLFGAFQMRLDKTHKGISFLKLMFLSLKKFWSFLKEVDKPDKPDKPTTK